MHTHTHTDTRTCTPYSSSTAVTVPAQMTEVCEAIDALNSKERDEFLRWFVAQELQDYRRSFRQQDDSFRLENTDRRIVWIKRALKRYDEVFVGVLPKQWAMDQNIAEEFCFLTREHLTTELDKRQIAGALVRCCCC